MAIYFVTNDPGELLSSFKKAIDDGKAVTWSYDTDGDFTHTPSQWSKAAWLRPDIQQGQLALFIVKPRNTKISKEVYGVYHGRFIESMLTHCDASFSNGVATAMPEGRDQI